MSKKETKHNIRYGCEFCEHDFNKQHLIAHMINEHKQAMTERIQQKMYNSDVNKSITTKKPLQQCFSTFIHNDRSTYSGVHEYKLPIAICIGCNNFWIIKHNAKKRADNHVCSDCQKHVSELEEMKKPIVSTDAEYKKLLKAHNELKVDYDDKDQTQQFEYLMFERLLWAINKVVPEHIRETLNKTLVKKQGNEERSAPYSFPDWESKLGLDGSIAYPQFPAKHWDDSESESESNTNESEREDDSDHSSSSYDSE
jgi:hypothetical protein